MQVKIVITLHVCLFLRKLIKSCSIVLTVLLKKLKKIVFRKLKLKWGLEFKAEFLVELKTRQFKKVIYSYTKGKRGDSSKTFENPSWLGMRNGA